MLRTLRRADILGCKLPTVRCPPHSTKLQHVRILLAAWILDDGVIEDRFLSEVQDLTGNGIVLSTSLKCLPLPQHFRGGGSSC